MTDAALAECERLFNLLDDIDTADDAAKGDDAAFRQIVRHLQRKRFDGGITTDGYTLDLAALRSTDNAEQPEGVEPAYMKWPALRELLHRRVMDNDYEDGDLVATRAETCALMGWASYFDRRAQPRRDEEERAYDIIRRAADHLASKPDDASALLREALTKIARRVSVTFGSGTMSGEEAARIADAALNAGGGSK